MRALTLSLFVLSAAQVVALGQSSSRHGGPKLGPAAVEPVAPGLMMPSQGLRDERPSAITPPREWDGVARDRTEIVPPRFASLHAESVGQDLELRRYKRQALQSVGLSAGLLTDFSEDGLSSKFLDVSIGTGIPLGSFDNIIAVRPRVRIDWIDAEQNIDVPSRLYAFETQFFYRRPLRKHLSMMAIIAPSIRSDLTTDNRALRFFALGLLNWECIPERLTLSGGAVSLGRSDLPVLPALGVMWRPNPRTRLDLRFPQSILAYRLEKDGRSSEKWVSLTLGIGGNTWAVTRADSQTDELSLRDVRLTARIEKLLDGGGGAFAEVGWAAGRTIEYENDAQDVELDDAILMQFGWRY